MSDDRVSAAPEGVENTSACSCCGRAVFEGSGVLSAASGDLADYWYRWTDGHESRFALAISACDADGYPCGGIAVVACRREGGSMVYSVLEPDKSPWPASQTFGPVLTREQALSGEVVPNLFALVDAIAANEPRLSSRILGTNEA